MLDDHAAMLTLRNRLLTARIVDAINANQLAAVVDGYTRADGSFIVDGFALGMEVTPAGFVNNTITIVKEVTALKLSTTARIPEVSSPAHSLSVALPPSRTWENKPNDDSAGWVIEEEYVSGPNTQDTLGPLGMMSHNPIYIIKVYGLPDIGTKSLYRMAKSILDVFQPRLALTLVDGTVLRVNSVPAPSRGQVLYDDGKPLIVVTIPLWARTQNTI